MIKYLKTVVVAVVVLMAVTDGLAQKYPVRSQVNIAPPYPVYLSEYFAVSNSQLMVNLLFTDMSEPVWDVKLRFTLEGDGIQVTTNPRMVPAPIELVAGVPQVLYAADMAEYFDFNNLIFGGLNANDLLRNGRLKEGHYKFCFEVLDYRSGKAISDVACANVWLILKEPPYIISPANGTHVSTTLTQQIPFQWQMANDASVSLENPTEYQLSLYEILDPQMDPLYAITANRVLNIFTSEWTTDTRYIYGMDEPQLDIGKKYAFQVQARNEGGQSQFKNNGFSQVGWFYYGYPANGHINLSHPASGHAYARHERQNFRWSPPDNLLAGQVYSYHLKIVTLEEGQLPAQAIEYSEPWYEDQSAPTTTVNDRSIIINQAFEPNTRYAWQVRAFTAEEEVAASPVYTFDGPPILDGFNAGGHLITVKSCKGDLNDLSGVALVPLGGDELVEVPFEHVSVELLAGNYVLQSGELLYDMSHRSAVELEPDYDANGPAYFHTRTLRVDKDAFSVLGYVKWPMPHPVTSTTQAYVTSKETWVDYGQLLFNGLMPVAETVDYPLLDPLNFTLTVADNSDFLIQDNKFRIRFNGHITLPASVKATTHHNPITYDFKLQEQIYSFDFAVSEGDKQFYMGGHTNISIQPKEVVVDLSESVSPDRWSSDPEKKGLYLKKMDLHLPINTDPAGQLILAKHQVYALNQQEADMAGWIGPSGLDFKYTLAFTDPVFGWFNQFAARFHEISLHMESNRFADVNANGVTGAMAIPLLDAAEEFAFSVPLRSQGFLPGTLDESLAGRTIVLSEGDADTETSVEVVQAHFEHHDRLAFTVNVAYEATGVYLDNVTGLKLWGNGDFGFNTPNGAIALSHPTQGMMGGNYELEVDSVRAVQLNNNYVLGIKAGVNVGPSVSSPNHGLPRVDMMSGRQVAPGQHAVVSGAQESAHEEGGFFTSAGSAIVDASRAVAMPFGVAAEGIYEAGKFTKEAVENIPELGKKAVGIGYKFSEWGGAAQDVYFDYVNGAGFGTGSSSADYVWTMPVAWKSSAGWAAGVLNYVKNQSAWGNFWQGVLHVSLTKPFKATVGAQLLIGKKGNTDYWLAKLSAKSKDIGVATSERQGIVLGPVTITELRGAIYHHMVNYNEQETGQQVNDLDMASLTGAEAANDFQDGLPGFEDLEFEDNQAFDRDRSYYGSEDFLTVTRQYNVDEGIAYGGNLRMQLIDSRTGGEVITAALSADLEFTTAGDLQTLHLIGSLGLNNKRTGSNKAGLKSRYSEINSDYIGGAQFYYNTTSQHMIGSVNFEMSNEKRKVKKGSLPFCLKANARFESTPSSWQLDLGNRYSRIILDKGCAGIKYQGWLGFGTERLDAGLGFLFQQRVETGWVDIEIAKFNAAAEVGLQSTVFVGFDLKPQFRFREGGAEVEAWANVKIDYQSFLKDGSFDLLDARLRGILFFKDEGDSHHFYGTLQGHAKVLGVGVGFNFNPDVKL